MSDPSSDKNDPYSLDCESIAERPLECSQCKRDVQVWYTEIVGKQITETIMCAECPHLHRRLRGAAMEVVGDNEVISGAGLCCGDCGTTLSSVRMGHSFGCPHCYDVFGDVLIEELAASRKLPSQLNPNERPKAVHVGRSPGQKERLSPSLQLVALNEALKDTLSSEDYEQAAWLRDQIQELTEHTDDGEE